MHILPKRLDRDRVNEIVTDVMSGSKPEARYWVMLALSTTIAAYGLLANSAPVVIGAMIIAPLMGPILGTALGIVSGQQKMLRLALTSELLGVLLVVGVSWVIGIAPLNIGISQEMLARTSPTLYDLLIAIAAGLAAAYASVNSRVGSSLPGVAIAVALVPPLASAGLLLALGNWDLAGGALLLFLANFLAIQIAAGFVFSIFGVSEYRFRQDRFSVSVLLRMSPSIIGMAAIGVFMTITLSNIIREKKFDQTVFSVLHQEFSTTTGGFLSEIAEKKRTSDGYEIVAVVLTPRPFTPAQISRAQAKLEQATGEDIHLIVRSVVSRDSDSDGQVFQTYGERSLERQKTSESEFLADVQNTATEFLSGIPGARLESIYRADANGGNRLTAVVSCPTAVTPDQVSQMERHINEKVGKQVQLVVRSLLTKDADRERFLYDVKEDELPQPTGLEKELRPRIESALRNQFANIEGATLSEFTLKQQGRRLDVDAIVEAPAAIAPEQVLAIQRLFREHVYRGIYLRVRTDVTATASASGWLK